MNSTLATIAILAYLIGSIPFGLLLTAAAGLGDIRKLGSGNIGATNVLRTGRRGLAAATLLLDGLKGAAAVWIGLLLLPVPLGAATAAIFVALGHCFPVWLRFAGGKGVATMLGIALALDWRAGLICIALWLAIARLTRISSAGGIGSAVALPVLLLALGAPAVLVVAGLGVTLLVLGRHHANIGRLLAGTEPRIGGGHA
jgi:glycerol-3-phosphate acyltransferase PlsY